jgi:hypothetical protein
VLAGETALGRNLDWTRGPDDVLPRNTVVVGYLPSDPGKRPWSTSRFRLHRVSDLHGGVGRVVAEP